GLTLATRALCAACQNNKTIVERQDGGPGNLLGSGGQTDCKTIVSQKTVQPKSGQEAADAAISLPLRLFSFIALESVYADHPPAQSDCLFSLARSVPGGGGRGCWLRLDHPELAGGVEGDRKGTRLNSSHGST